MNIKKIFLVSLLAIILIGLGYGEFEYKQFMTPPLSRLAPGSYYPEMPPDIHHIYLQLPIDHHDPSLGTFTAFYLLSPHFKTGDPVIFQLYDNQQEKVGMITEDKHFEIFDEVVGPGKSYVLIGNRGVSPTLFPEVFDKNGLADLVTAINLYGSGQQVEDIELIRQDMIKKDLLPPDGKIIVTGGSGGGFLVQQYLDKYGDHVSRTLIESTGAPDISQQNNTTFARNLLSTNKEAAGLYFDLFKQGKTDASLAWMLFKMGLDGNTKEQIELLKDERHFINFTKLRSRTNISYNSGFVSLIFSSPATMEVRVRIWELIGADLLKYNPQRPEEIIPMYESMKVFLDDFMEAARLGRISPAHFDLHRKNYDGEIMVWANQGDQDFDPANAARISDQYLHSRLLVFRENTHRIRMTNFHYSILDAFFGDGLASENLKSILDDNRDKMVLTHPTHLAP